LHQKYTKVLDFCIVTDWTPSCLQKATVSIKKKP